MNISYARTIAALLALCATALTVPSASAQIDPSRIESSAGTLYIVGFPDTTMNTFDARYPNRAYVDRAILLIYSAVPAHVNVVGRGYDTSFTTVGGSFASATLMGGTGGRNASAPIVIEHCKAVTNTFRIASDVPIIVYQYLVTKFGTEAWTPLPVEAWGTEYYAAAMPGEIGSDIWPGGEFDYNRKNKMFPAEILVVAAYDNTTITIVPNGDVLNDCRTDSITLRAGEAYQIQSLVDTLTANIGGPQPDFGGSRIFSTKPIGVISGNARAQLIDENAGLGKNIFKNMQIEWLSPVEQHGTEFVYMPTWDSRRPTGVAGEDPAEKRKAEFVRVYSTHAGTTATTYTDTLGNVVSAGQDKPEAGFSQIRFYPNAASVIRSSQPAQAMMNVPAVVKYAGTTNGFGGYVGAAYDGWGGYMVALTPREKWVDFAPFFAAVHPGGMEYHINVVTDTAHAGDIYLKNGSAFIFQRRIAGTDLIWGSMAVTPGVDNWLDGRNGATFGGFVYGGLTRGGHEEYRPGRVRELEDDPPGLANPGTGDESAQPLHPSEYEEYLAIAFGYPLASSHVVAAAGDSLSIRAEKDCQGTCLTIETLNPNPSGLRSVRLEGGTNATIASITPVPLAGATSARVCIEPIDRHIDASATVVIKDMAGEITEVPFVFLADSLRLGPSSLSFGRIPADTRDTLVLTVKNPLGRPQTIDSIRLSGAGSAFTLIDTAPLPRVLAPQDSMRILVEAHPLTSDLVYGDTVLIAYECSVARIPVSATTMIPCVEIWDLDFGALPPGTFRSRLLHITNAGGDTVSFVSPYLDWTRSEFVVAPGELARLGAARLTRGQSIDITVTFVARTGSTAATIRDTARLWASTHNCRDTSIWVATIDPSAGAPLDVTSTTSLEASQPNPTDGVTEIRFSLAERTRATLVLYDERGARVATLVDEEREAGAHVVRIDATPLPAGVYHYRLSAGQAHLTRSFVRK